MRIQGREYRATRLEPEHISQGAFLRHAWGMTYRRVVGRDGDEVILRGIRSRDVLEAIAEEALLEDWYLLVPADA